MRYTVTITEYDDDEYDPDAKVVRSTPHTGEAVEVLAVAIKHRHKHAEPEIDIRRGPEGITVDLAELIEVARISATTAETRKLWVETMVTEIRGWVYPLGRRLSTSLPGDLRDALDRIHSRPGAPLISRPTKVNSRWPSTRTASLPVNRCAPTDMAPSWL